MATFVHICAERDQAKIRRNGITMMRTGWREVDGVFLSPLTEDHTQTHQWMREVQRVRNVPKLAVRVRIPDDERVHIGKYNERHIEVTGAEAIAVAREHDDPWGLEVVLPRAVHRSEIMKFYRPPKVVGWRYSPESKGKKPCPCPYCQRGEPGGRRLRASADDDES
ncbi:MAG: hypothetical protein AAF488_04575 [Planctomycetota bacterium]